jgi:ABC-type oligopeptide transport system substrate-binding subunit
MDRRDERGAIWGEKFVKIRRYLIGVAMLAALALAGCGHKLVAHGGDTTVAVYPDKASFERLKNLQSQGGPAGMIGGLGASLVAKKVDNGTPIKVISSDEDGYQIEVLDGANKGISGYVSKDSVD